MAKQTAAKKSRGVTAMAAGPAIEAAGNTGSETTLLRNPLLVPGLLAIGIFLLSFISRVQQNEIIVWSFRGAAFALLIWTLFQFVQARREGRAVSFVASLHRHHYIQAMVHSSVYIYWGSHWDPVAAHVPMLIAQIMFAYAFDMLLSWSRRDTYMLGFGPFPIIFSTNLFLWFRDDWFYLQFIMVAVGFMGKEFVRWNRDGRYVHIFNPSAFTLGLFSIVLLLTNNTDMTWGREIASTLTLAPMIYLYLFLGGLVVMYFFSITLVVMTGTATLLALSAIYWQLEGVPYFLDSEIPSAVFLGVLLLVTDPSTSPRTPPGKIIFGILYGSGVFILYSLLTRLGLPTFYDKLLCVPLLNLSVQFIDRFARSIHYTPLLKKLGLDTLGGRNNLIHMAVWIVFFGAMSMLGRLDGRHPGDTMPFWETACVEGRANACDRLVQLKTTYCSDGSGWACNEVGVHFMQGQLVQSNPDLAVSYFSRACELRFQAGCLNVLNPSGQLVDNPRELDLRLLLREGGLNLLDMSPEDLRMRACEHGWSYACT